MSTRAPDPAVARVAARLQARVKPLADEITNLIAEQIDFYRSGSVVTRADLRRSVEHNFSCMLGQLVRPQPPDLSAPRETGRLRAEQGAPLPEILRAYRLAFAFLWERLLAEVRHFADNALHALLDPAIGIWELADDYCLALTEAYRQAMTSQMISADRRRSALVAALITHAVNIDNVHAAVNYGLSKVRFPAPVPAGSRVRGRVVLASAAPRGDAIEAAFGLTVEIEGAPRPACVAEILVFYR